MLYYMLTEITIYPSLTHRVLIVHCMNFLLRADGACGAGDGGTGCDSSTVNDFCAEVIFSMFVVHIIIIVAIIITVISLTNIIIIPQILFFQLNIRA